MTNDSQTNEALESLEPGDDVAHSGMRPVIESPGHSATTGTTDLLVGAALFLFVALGLGVSELDWTASHKVAILLVVAAVESVAIVATYTERGRARRSALLLLAVAATLVGIFVFSSVADRDEYEPDIAQFERAR